MSTDQSVTPGGSRPSNVSNPAQSGTEPNTPDSENGVRPEGLPTVGERVDQLCEEYPDRMKSQISTEHGRRLREEALAEPVEQTREVEIGEHEVKTVRETVGRGALPLRFVVEEFLEWYEDYRDKYLRMAKGDGFREEKETFLVDLENSFQPGYQARTYARLQALRRQTAGGEYPDGSETEGEFEEPTTVLFGLTASGVRDDGFPKAAADHDREIRDAWSGSSSSVKRTLRYVLEDKLGLDSREYAWWFQSEPHPGDGANAGYSHAHPVVVLDGDAADVPTGQIEAETFRPVVAKHVAECDGAEWDAHRLGEAVEVKEPGEVEDFAGYVSEYLAVSPDDDLLERSDEYLLWAATQWATTTQKYSKSKTATEALNVDKCHQRAADPEAEQVAEHGEELRRRDGEVVCRHCRESFGVEEPESLARHRLGDAEPSGVVATDGGEKASESGESGGGSDAPEWVADVGSRWQDARSAGVSGCPTYEKGEEPEWTVKESTARAAPEWSPEAVVKKATDEETLIGSPGGVEYGEVDILGEGSIASKVDRDHLRAEWLKGERPWERHPVSESAVRSGELPPPELVTKEHAELNQSNRRVTAKQWSNSWYAERHEGDADSDGGVKIDEERVEELARITSMSPVGICGRMGLPPSARSRVEEVAAAVRE